MSNNLQNNLDSEMTQNSNTTNTTGVTNNVNAQRKYNNLLKAVQMGTKQNKILKVLTTTNLSDILQVNKWWKEEENLMEKNDNKDEEDTKWKNLQHNGLLFAPKYEPHGIKIKFKGATIELTQEQEEIATFWAGLLDNDLSLKTITRNNFIKEFRKVMGKPYDKAELEDFDFKPIHEHILETREKNKNKTPEEKKTEKERKLKLAEHYGYSIIDGRLEKIANCMVEPPGIFRGRGEHPASGKLKARIVPENVTLNIGNDDMVPRCHLPGHSWKEVVHNPDATWLAFFKDEQMDKQKYIFLAGNSKFKGINDLRKYEKARKLRDNIGKIRDSYSKMLSSNEMQDRQLAVATYLIDKLALRVGNEKGEDEADTVGCCSLRVEHVELEPNSNNIILDFLGKDSMRYHNTVEVDPKVYKNIHDFKRGKNKEDNLFDMINAGKLNDYLKSLMPSLSAKVFRTYNASVTLQQEIDKKQFRDSETLEDRINYYNEANRQVAILCNHQKTVSKSYNSTSEALQNQLNEYKTYLHELEEHSNSFNSKKSKKHKKMEDKKEDDEDDKKNKKKLKKVFPDTKEKTDKLIDQTQKKIEKQEATLKKREENKEVALGTSKLNYMDPRITVSWCKNNEVPIEKVFTKSIRDKFPWAMYSELEYKF